ncbi:MAG: maleylpyruvate isomerase family mycothiol-dependent enzyme [Microthrixaceae bacterium]|nr:maleylpyruvate isomerase family mycothiol-dependent enzyme [Microthrixaceae bacterium]
MASTLELIAVHRRATADLLDGLGDDEWSAPSLCDAWSVREVAGHLISPFVVSVPRILLLSIRHRGPNAAMRELARDLGRRPRAELVATLRENAEHRFKPPGLPHEAPLTDIVVHTLDITVPLERPVVSGPDALQVVLDFLVSPVATRGFLPRDRVRRLRLVATDLGWTHGEGQEVSGPGWALALALTGRPAGLDHLEGEGVPALRDRVVR